MTLGRTRERLAGRLCLRRRIVVIVIVIVMVRPRRVEGWIVGRDGRAWSFRVPGRALPTPPPDELREHRAHPPNQHPHRLRLADGYQPESHAEFERRGRLAHLATGDGELLAFLPSAGRLAPSAMLVTVETDARRNWSATGPPPRGICSAIFQAATVNSSATRCTSRLLWGKTTVDSDSLAPRWDGASAPRTCAGGARRPGPTRSPRRATISQLTTTNDDCDLPIDERFDAQRVTTTITITSTITLTLTITITVLHATRW